MERNSRSPHEFSREAFMAGSISRNEYWKSVSAILAYCKEFSEVLPSDEVNLRISKGLIEVEFLAKSILSSKRFVLELDPMGFREAGFQIVAMGSYEEFFSFVFFHMTTRSSVFFDIGCNVGYHTIGASKFNPGIQVFAFEPNPKIAKTLISNLKRNEVSLNTEVLEIALGSETSKLTLKVPEANGSPGATLIDLYAGNYSSTVDVEVKMLDSFYGVKKCDLIKIDVEGFEFNVIQGGLQFIARNRPVIFIELLRKWMAPLGHHPNNVIQALTDLGYKCFAISSNSLNEISVVDEKTIETNFLFIHSSDDRFEDIKGLIH